MNRVIFSTLFAVAAVGVLVASEIAPSLVEPYVRVQSALAADKIDGVKADAAAIGAAAGKLGEPAEPIAAAAKRLEEAANLKDARKAFGEVSDALFAYVKTTGATMPAGVKRAYCPMVNKSWLQKGDKIQNPYYGSEMLDCGSFR
jgi:Protein of unknown function (DUF3347)